MNTDPQHDDPANLARWLEEVGRRKYKPSASAQEEEPRKTPRSGPPRRVARPELMFLLGQAASAYLLYYLVDVQLQILTVPAVVVFVAG